MQPGAEIGHFQDKFVLGRTLGPKSDPIPGMAAWLCLMAGSPKHHTSPSPNGCGMGPWQAGRRLYGVPAAAGRYGPALRAPERAAVWPTGPRTASGLAVAPVCRCNQIWPEVLPQLLNPPPIAPDFLMAHLAIFSVCGPPRGSVDVGASPVQPGLSRSVLRKRVQWWPKPFIWI